LAAGDAISAYRAGIAGVNSWSARGAPEADSAGPTVTATAEQQTTPAAIAPGSCISDCTTIAAITDPASRAAAATSSSIGTVAIDDAAILASICTIAEESCPLLRAHICSISGSWLVDGNPFNQREDCTQRGDFEVDSDARLRLGRKTN
jgi:hypothetical protein